MGLFDIKIEHKTKSKKDILPSLKTELQSNSKESLIKKNKLTLNKFKPPKSFLNYNLEIDLSQNSINIEGELQNVLIITILIILSILLTQGIGVILIVAYVYYQKTVATKYLNSLIEKLKL